VSYLKYWGWARRSSGEGYPITTSEIVRDNPEEVIAWLVTEHIMDPKLKGVVVLLQTHPSVREVLRRIPADAKAWWECNPSLVNDAPFTIYGRMVDADGRRLGGVHCNVSSEIEALAVLIGREQQTGGRAEAAVVQRDDRTGRGTVIDRWNGGKAWWE